MAHPWIFESNFEQGTNAEWDSESDTGSKLDFPHYTTLATIKGAPMPYRGAYCMRIQCGDTNDHTLTEGDIDIADAGTAYFRWYLFASSDFTATADDTFNIFELQQSGGTVEQSVGMRVTSATNALDIGIGDGTAPTSFATFPRNKWVCVELLATISTGGAGAMTLFLDGTQVIALTTLTQAAAVGQGVLGTQDTLSTTTGTLYFDQFIADDARVYPLRERFPINLVMTTSGHAFVGPGWVDGAALVSTTAGHTIQLYDTDTANAYDAQSFGSELLSTNHTAMSGPIQFKRGCYVKMTGTSVRGEVYLVANSEKPGVRGPLYYSDAMMRRYAHLRKARILNV